MPKVLHDPITEAMDKKFPLKLRCAKCKRTLEFSVEELEVKKEYENLDKIKSTWSTKFHKVATCKCVCGHELSTADRDVIFVVENYVPTVSIPPSGGTAIIKDEPLQAKMNRIFDEIRAMEVTPFIQIVDFLIDQGISLEQFQNRYEDIKGCRELPTVEDLISGDPCKMEEANETL